MKNLEITSTPPCHDCDCDDVKITLQQVPEPSETIALTPIYSSTPTQTPTITVTPSVSPVVLRADAGQDETIPVGQATVLRGGKSTGKIKSYHWSKISGPEELEMLTPNEFNTWIRHMSAGEYLFRLTVKDEVGNESHDDTKIIVYPVGVTATPTPTKTPTLTPSISVSNTHTPSLTPSSTPTITPSISRSQTPTPTPTMTSTRISTVEISTTPSHTPAVTPSLTPSVTPSPTPKPKKKNFFDKIIDFFKNIFS